MLRDQPAPIRFFVGADLRVRPSFLECGASAPPCLCSARPAEPGRASSDFFPANEEMYSPSPERPLKLRFRVRIEQVEDGMFVVECPNLPGCISQGATRAEALANIRDAIEGYLASLEKHGEPVPPPISEEIIEVSTK
jgi:antitoxin HicB